MPKGRDRLTQPKVLAISSAGGHFVQLCRLMPAWEACQLTVVSTDAALQAEVDSTAALAGLPSPRFLVVKEANRHQWGRLLMLVLGIMRILFTIGPDVIITTGAAPGYLALRIGKLLGARTVWIDSIANTDKLSLSGRKVALHADLWLTQWPELAIEGGPQYKGSVL